MYRTLNGSWSFCQAEEGLWRDAQVPGCNFLDLMRNDLIPDPFISLNEKEVQWVGRKDWEYKRTFKLTENELGYDEILLDAKMLDTLCDVYVNDQHLFHSDNCFTPYVVSVKSFLKPGENEIRIRFHSPVKYVEERHAASPAPKNANGQDGIVHIRKPQCHFGWDWGPVLPCSGITKDIGLTFVNGARIEYLKPEQELINGMAHVNVTVDISAYADRKYECEICLVHPDGKTERATVPVHVNAQTNRAAAPCLDAAGDDSAVSADEMRPSRQKASTEFVIEHPELWWTRELSGKDKQPLYTVRTTLFADDKPVDEQSKQIGIRTIELNRERDAYGQNFQFRLNGVPLFIKGTNYIPADSFITRFDGQKLDYLLDAVVFSNMNMIRVWGGGYYESDEFYQACDERGILVWQDFPFACQAYPFFDDAFLTNVKKEVAHNVRRLCHHPSLALWCGNNEIESMYYLWRNMKEYLRWTKLFFYDILEPELRKQDTHTPYIPGSPTGISYNDGVNADNVGDTHLWNVWHGLQPMNYYRKRMTRFCSEFGFESLPDLKAIEQFATPADYALDSDVFTAHQKCTSGNDKMIFYITSRFHLPKRFEDYIYLSQVAQLECVADATEHWRRNKGRCNGSMYWQLNDCWGVCSWASMDYYGNYKALQYGARHFNAPLSLSIEDTDRQVLIHVLNDLLDTRDVEVECEIFDFTKGTLKMKRKTLRIAALSNRKAFCLNVPALKAHYDKRTTGIAARLYVDGKLLQQKTVLLDAEKRLRFPRANLRTDIAAREGGLQITVRTDTFARLVKVESDRSTLPFSDNFFDILPNGEKTVTMDVGDGLSADPSLKLDELAKSIHVYSLCDIPFGKNPFKAKWKRMKLYLSPMNTLSAMAQAIVPPDVEVIG